MKVKSTIILIAVTAVGLLLAGGILATMHIGAAAATTLNPQQPSEAQKTESGPNPEVYLVKDIYSGTNGYIFNLTEMGGVLYFASDDGVHGRELWRTDGTPAGTTMVRDIYSGSEGSNLKYFTVVSGTLFFSADDGAHGYELWKSDGTMTGTVLVRDIYTTATGSNPQYLVAYNDKVYFQADEGVHGQELWTSDGTYTGTEMVREIYAGTGGSSPKEFREYNDRLYFQASDYAHRAELWETDGTRDGTVLVKDIWPGTDSSGCRNFAESGGYLFFKAYDGAHGGELWKTDGTMTGTVLVRDINTNTVGAGTQNSNPEHLTDINGTLYFAADGTYDGYKPELWKSDGTYTGTVQVKDINPGADKGSYPAYITNFNGTAFFAAWEETNGEQLWTSDGTEGGTQILKIINPSVDDTYIYGLEVISDTLFFNAKTPTYGEEPFTSDGTPEGTLMLSDINPGSADSSPEDYVFACERVFMRASHIDYGTELWAYGIPPVDLVIQKQVNPGGLIVEGDPITYTLTYSNIDIGTAFGATILDQVPSDITDLSYTSSLPITPTGSISYTWDLGDIPPGTGGVITITGTFSPLIGGYIDITNTTVISSSVEDENPLDNTSTVTSPAFSEIPIAGLSVTNDSPTPVSSMTTLTATVSSGTNVAYAWDFGDGVLGSGSVVQHEYPATGEYTAVVTATNSLNSLVGSTMVTVEVWEPLGYLYVEPAGICGGHSPCYDVIQDAVDAGSEYDAILVAGGTYAVSNTIGGDTQLVFIQDTLSIRGGYSSDFSTRDPIAYPTILDAQDDGRGVTIESSTVIFPILDGLIIRNGYIGQTTGFSGGGILINEFARAIIQNCEIFDNYGFRGGGVSITYTPHVKITNNQIHDNSSYDTSGVYVHQADNVVVSNNKLYNNTSESTSTYGGVYLGQTDDAYIYGNEIYGDPDMDGIGGHWNQRTLIERNEIYGSATAIALTLDNDYSLIKDNLLYDNYCGIKLEGNYHTVQGNIIHSSWTGMFIGADSEETATGLKLIGNQVHHNQAISYPGIRIASHEQGLIANNQIHDNTASEKGGGLYITLCDQLDISNNYFYNNTANWGSAIYSLDNTNLNIFNNMVTDNHPGLYESSVHLENTTAIMTHNTIARNMGTGETYAIILNGGQLNMENNIVVAHWAGVVVGGTAVIDHTLWGAGEWDNLYYDYSGSTITETNGIDGDPAFQNPDEYNYHITTTSAALDAGVDAGVTGDIDGEVRPLGTGFDIGADELNYDVLSLPPGSSISTSDGLLDLISDSTCTGTFTITYSSLSTPTYGTGNMMVGGMVFHLEATNSSGDPVISVSPPMTLTVGYDEGALLVDMDEVDLEILRYNVGLEDWVALTLIELDTLANTITVVLDHFSEFVVAGPGVPYRIMLPLILKD